MQKWSEFEHQIWKILKNYSLHEISGSYLLAVSGGLDSMVLLELFGRLVPKKKIKVLHYHHGSSDNNEQQIYRDSSQELVARAAHQLGCFYATETSEAVLRSEEDFRNSRLDFFKRQTQAGDVLVMAHHQDDRLETMLLKLIRGTGLESFDSFQIWNARILRPLLVATKVELTAYAQSRGLKWVDDPSNQDGVYLRNWLRLKWLPELEQKQAGAVDNLAKSLFRIASQLDSLSEFKLVFDTDSKISALSRPWYLTLSQGEQSRALALYLKSRNIGEFTSGQIEEIKKRLDKNQKDITFELLGRKWVINATQIVLE